jgi:CBS-domain-containing membrane protein
MTKNPIWLTSTTAVGDAVEQLRVHTFSTVPILDDSGNLLGLVSSVRLRETNAQGGGKRLVRELVAKSDSIELDEPLVHAVLTMNQNNVRQLAVVAPGHPKRLVGMLTMSDVFRSHTRATADGSTAVAQSARVQDVMTQGRPFVTFEPDTPAREMLRHVSEATWQEVFPVIDEGKKMMGLVSSDAIRVLALERDDALWALATDVMQPPIVVTPSDDLRKATELIVTNSLREIPVVDGNQRVIGFLDEREIARSFLKEGGADTPVPVGSA